jgi:hypothetical protein
MHQNMFDLIYYTREVVAEEISSEELRGASERASEVQKAFDRQRSSWKELLLRSHNNNNNNPFPPR